MPPHAHSTGGKKKNKKNKKNPAENGVDNLKPAVVKPMVEEEEEGEIQVEISPSFEKSQEDLSVDIIKENNTITDSDGLTDMKLSCEKTTSTSNNNNNNNNDSKEEVVEIESKTVEENDPVAPVRRKSESRSNPESMHSPQICKTGSLPSREGIKQRSRNSSASYIRGQVVKPSLPPSTTLASSVADLVNDVMPKNQYPGASHLPPVEKAEWIQISTIEKAGNRKERLNVMVIGLVRGFQIWTLNNNGECEELLSERQGPIRACRILPNNVKVGKNSDPFHAHRPLMAIVDASSHIVDKQYCSVQIVSLATGKEVHKITFDEPVTAINTSDQYMAISLSSRVFVYELVTFGEVRNVRTAVPCEGYPPAIAISGQMLAYSDTQLNTDIQSSGGLAVDVEARSSYKYSDKMKSVVSTISTIGRTVKSIGESVGAATTSGASSKNNSPKGIVTVVNLKSNDDEDVLFHWIAHEDEISHISFSPDQRLILAGDSNATVFNLFLMMAHPLSAGLSAVQHLYKLNRGNTPAKITSTSFSNDCRWLAICTNHGTCHLFSICPFGGKPTQRTHSDFFVNKESRYHLSAGLADGADVAASVGPTRQRSLSSSSGFTKDHPVVAMYGDISRTSGNSRIGPFPPPLGLNATKKIKDQPYSTDNLTAWASDMTYLPLSNANNSKRKIDATRIAVSFSVKNTNPTQRSTGPQPYTLYIAYAAVNGAYICEYELRPRLKDPSTGQLYADNDPPKLDINASAMWTLQRTKNNADMHLPMPPASPIISYSAKNDSEAMKNASNGSLNELWPSYVESKTFQPPPRWLWLGPQFTFYEYKEEDSTQLMSPSESQQPSSAFKSIPVVVDGGTQIRGMNIVPVDVTRIECGSFTSSNSFVSSNYNPQTDISLQIADAMREVPFTEPEPQDNDSTEEFFDTHSPTIGRRGSKTGKKAPMCATSPLKPIDQDDLDDFDAEDLLNDSD